MGAIGTDNKVKLFCGIISSNDEIDKKVFDELEKRFGKIELKSETVPFDYSAYYNEEMGDKLNRYWISFEKLIFSGELADIKIFTNSVEDSLAKDGKRPINIDPGYITQANVILATTKNFSHRIYLAKGIYGEITTIYKKSEGYIKLPWSYPDYMSKVSTDFLLQIRQKYLLQLKNERN
ncbi:MAG: DUF4416 family protein [Elusimicrobiota bacterium]|jgi:hypothetical protein|nr:DUF4416 family protein [Elusimicrobiota bacterium]